MKGGNKKCLGIIYQHIAQQFLQFRGSEVTK